MRLFGAIRGAMRAAGLQVSEERSAEDVIARITWGRGPRPAYWDDREVRRLLVVARLRNDRTTIDGARAICLRTFGGTRTPSRSAIARLWRRIQDQGLHARGVV